MPEEEKTDTQKEVITVQKKVISEPEADVRTQTELKADDWLCLACNKKITTDKDRFEFNNQSEYHFINPTGYHFDIILFSEAEGCRELGDRTMEFTWFAKHAWSYAVCSRCGNHLGWKYTGKYSFYGLIRTRIIKGEALFN
ncbi:MAG TPA: cereblon family protein [Ignavibacteriaceae bacterium]|nr:cereblon family protein [Ignavibacteriaceae bacterium]